MSTAGAFQGTEEKLLLPTKNLGQDPIVIRDTSTQSLHFNVMPDRPVSETLTAKEYRVWGDCVEAEFDRAYSSSMLNSPDHLIFLTALIQVQRITYLLMCLQLDLPYEPFGPELVKIWPTDIRVSMPKMVTQTAGLVHTLRMTKLKRTGPGRFFAQTISDVSGIIEIEASAVIYVL
jgi:hypothetical protein